MFAARVIGFDFKSKSRRRPITEVRRPGFSEFALRTNLQKKSKF